MVGVESPALHWPGHSAPCRAPSSGQDQLPKWQWHWSSHTEHKLAPSAAPQQTGQSWGDEQSPYSLPAQTSTLGNNTVTCCALTMAWGGRTLTQRPQLQWAVWFILLERNQRFNFSIYISHSHKNVLIYYSKYPKELWNTFPLVYFF